jgi:predicted dehydrogenase
VTAPIRWGVVATGSIAGAFADDLAATEGAEVAAVVSRSAERARAFAAERGIPRAVDDIEVVLRDGAVDVVYVATPHPQHAAPTRAALGAGVAVLAEKPLTADPTTARELIDLARRRGVLLAEGMWLRCHPLVVEAQRLVADGAIGEVRLVTADLGFPARYDPTGRLWAPELGGGALLDVGVYPVAFAHAFLPAPPRLAGVVGTLADTGVDADATLLLEADGVQARLSCSLVARLPSTASIVGTAGELRFDAPLFRPTRRTLVRPGRDDEVAVLEEGVPRFGYQIAEVHRCLRAGVTESPLLPHTDTLEVLDLLHEARTRLGAR